MCLACELDALWYAEWEQQAAEGADAAETGKRGTAGVPPALSEALARSPVESPAENNPAANPGGAEFEGAGAPSQAQAREDAEKASEMLTVPGFPAPGRAGGTPALQPRPRFLCEEIE
jgi:hypothetical protein